MTHVEISPQRKLGISLHLGTAVIYSAYNKIVYDIIAIPAAFLSSRVWS